MTTATDDRAARVAKNWSVVYAFIAAASAPVSAPKAAPVSVTPAAAPKAAQRRTDREKHTEILGSDITTEDLAARASKLMSVAKARSKGEAALRFQSASVLVAFGYDLADLTS